MHSCSIICGNWWKPGAVSCGITSATRRKSDVCSARLRGLFLDVRAALLRTLAGGVLLLAEIAGLQPEAFGAARRGLAVRSASVSAGGRCGGHVSLHDSFVPAAGAPGH